MATDAFAQNLASAMRAAGVPLFSMESAFPLASFDVVGFTIPHELAASNFVECLELAGIAPLAQDRAEEDPIVIGGGPSAYNPEPVSGFFDAIIIGDGEEAIVEVCACVRDARAAGMGRAAIHEALARIDGVYVPSLYEERVDEAGRRYVVPREGTGAPAVVTKRVVGDFAATDPLVTTIVPYQQIVHDRLAIEVLRGCARGCRFCQAGMTYRPVRERTADQVVAATLRGLACTGYDEVSLTSLSTTDHSQIAPILRRLNRSLTGTGISVSLPSERLDAFGVDMAGLVAGEKKGGLTFAPEAGTQRLRDVINKNVTEDDLMRAVDASFAAGWRRMKLYFMMGLPTETDEDVVGIAEMTERAYRRALDATPKGQRGGRELTPLILEAHRRGARFDAWSEVFDLTRWTDAAQSLGIDLRHVACDPFQVGAPLPWQHVSAAVSDRYLRREWERAQSGVTTPDCTFVGCTGCGVCPSLHVDNVIAGVRVG